MSWSELQPPVRAAIAAAAAVLVLVLVWVWFVSPMLDRRATVTADNATAQSQLEQFEREIESIPPAGDAERAAWRSSSDELLSRLGPESEVPFFLESLARLAESQSVDIFVTSGGAELVASGQGGRPSAPPSRSQIVLSSIAGVRVLPLDVSAFGEYEPTSRFIAQIGRLGWVTEITAVNMGRDFPEVATSIALNVYFRPSEAAGLAGAPGGGR